MSTSIETGTAAAYSPLAALFVNTTTNVDATQPRPDRRITREALQQRRLAPNFPEQALAFKDAMIHEVNHRAKNSLQVAASVLSIHARTTSSTEVREALQDSLRRLQVLAHAHELLYSNPNGKQLIAMPQLLQTLGGALRESFSSAPAQVELELTSEAMELPADTAIPLALLANEAVTNAYRHAFPNDAPGKITLHLGCTVRNGLVLQIADTGIGMHLSGGEDGMGLKLIRAFAAQLGGMLDFAAQTDSSGTVVTLTIARPEQHHRSSTR